MYSCASDLPLKVHDSCNIFCGIDIVFPHLFRIVPIFV